MLIRHIKWNLFYRNLLALLIITGSVCSCKKDKPVVGTPSGLSVTNVSDTGARISWSSVQNATGYHLTLALDNEFNRIFADSPSLAANNTSLDLNQLIPGTKYFVRLVAMNNTITGNAATTNFTTQDADGLVIAGSDDGHLYALNARTGAFSWIFSSGGGVQASPVVQDSILYIGGGDGKLYALNVADGTTKWSTDHLRNGAFLNATVTIKNRVIYAGDGKGYMYAFDISDGSMKWQYIVPDPYNSINTSAVVDDGGTTVYFGSYNGKVYALDAATGAFKWASTSTGNPILSGLALYNNTIYVGALPKVYAIDAQTGARKWQSQTPVYTSFMSSPTIYNNNVLIGGDDGIFYAYATADGSLNWSKPLSYGSIVASPIVDHGVLYIGDGDGKLRAMDPGTGNIIWTNANIGTRNIYSGPVVSDKYIYVGTSDGSMYCVSKSTGMTKWGKYVPGAKFYSSPCVVSYAGKVWLPGVSGEVQ